MSRRRQQFRGEEQQPNARNEEIAPEQATAQRYAEHFIEVLSLHIERDASRQGWGDETRQAVQDYVRSLTVFGHPTSSDLRDNVQQLIRARFALCCIMMNTRPQTFPGQSMKWYKDMAQYAEAYRAAKENHQGS